MKLIPLDLQKQSKEIVELRKKLEARIVGQPKAIDAVLSTYQTYLAGLSDPTKPIGNFLFLGPTGTGKTRTVEALAESLVGDPRAVIKIDCGEYQHSHEIAKLVGSPPGYLGHRETHAGLSQARLNSGWTDTIKVSFVLFDELEKASDALTKLLLAILDKATLTLGDNTRVDFSQAMIFMTSNEGSKEMQVSLSGANPGFISSGRTAENVEKVGLDSIKRKLSPEFFNRLDRKNVVVYNSLSKANLNQILDIELKKVDLRLRAAALGWKKPAGVVPEFEYSDKVKAYLLEKGTDPRYGARPLIQAVRDSLIEPLGSLVTTGQLGEYLVIYVDKGKDGLTFSVREEELKAA